MGACLSSCRKAAPPDGKDDDTTKLANGGQQQQAPPGNTADEIGGVDNKAFEDDRQGKGLLVESYHIDLCLSTCILSIEKQERLLSGFNLLRAFQYQSLNLLGTSSPSRRKNCFSNTDKIAHYVA